MTGKEETQDNRTNTPPPIIEMATMIYGVMGIVGLSISYWSHGNLSHLFPVPSNPGQWQKYLAITGLGSGVLLILSYFFDLWFASYRVLRRSVLAIFGSIGAFRAIYIAAISAVAEELLFRGAIQPSAGIFVASVLFGLVHLGPGGRITSWSLWAFLAGLLLGAVVDSTGSLAPGIAIHFIVNSVSMLMLQREWRRLSDGDRGALNRAEPAKETVES